jgi:hypothetical protein
MEKLNGELLTPIEVMQDNMQFYHNRAGEILAAIMQLPTATRDQQSDVQLEALKMMADHFRMRDKAGEAANMLARYVHRPLAAIPHKEGEKAPAEMPTTTMGKLESKPVVELIPLHPAADAAFRRAAQGLPPLPRSKL